MEVGTGSTSTVVNPYVSSDTCAATLAPGASCSVSIIAYKHELKTFGGNVKVTGQYIDPVLIPVSLSIVGTAPSNSLTSDSLSYAFGAIPVNTPSPSKRITFTYVGNSTATLTIPPSTSLINVSNDTCTSATLQPGNTCSVDLKITPSTSSHSVRALSWTPSYSFANSSPSPLPHQLTYQGLGETLVLIPSAISLPLSTTTSQSAGTYILYNTGNLPTTISSTHQTADSNWITSFNTAGCTTLQPGSSCPVTAIASSTQQGTYAGVLTFTGNTSNLTAPTSLTVSNTPALTLSSRYIDFGNVSEGSLVSAQSVQVTNIGGAPALLGTLSTTAPFQLNHNCPTSLDALSSCTLSFSLDTSATPPLMSAISDTVNLANTQPYKTDITLRGAYFGAEKNNLLSLSITPSSATFPYTPPGQASIPKPFVVYNDGELPQTLTFGTAGVDSSEYTVDSSSCASELPAFSYCTINVSYTPTRTLSIPQTTIVTGNVDGAAAVSAVVLASDIPVNALTFNPLKFDPANPPTGANLQNFYYKNTNATSLTITPQFQIGNQFVVNANTCSSVSSNSTCKITVQAKTALEGSFQDTMSVNGTLVSLSSTVLSYPSLTFTQAGNIITQLNYGTVSHKKPQPTSTVQLNNFSSSTADIKPTTFSSTSGISQLNNCGPSLPYGNPCDFQINVVPTTTKNPLNIDSYAWSSVLRVSTKDGQVTSALPIKGTSLVGTHSLPAAINFGTVYMGQTLTKPLSVTNASTNLAEISATSLSTGASDITHSTPCLGTWVPPGQSCDSILSFTPTSQGIRAGTINVGVISKSSIRRTIPWTATVLSGFTTEGLFTPNTWSPVTPVSTPLLQQITATNTYYQPLTFSASWTKSVGFPTQLTVQNDNCAGKTIQPQATCTFQLLLTSPNTYEKKTPTTLTTTLSPLGQTASISIPTVHITPGDPTINSLTFGSYPANYTVPGTAVKINGTGFGTTSSNTTVYIDDVPLTTTAIATGQPYAGWKMGYSTGTLLNLTVPASAPLKDYTVRVNNYGSPNDAVATLHVTTVGAASYTLTNVIPSASTQAVVVTGAETGTLPVNSTSQYFTTPLNIPTQYTLTVTNTGGMPYSYYSGVLPTPTITNSLTPGITINSNTCTTPTLQPNQSCAIIATANMTSTGGADYIFYIPTSFSNASTAFRHYTSAYTVAINSVSAPSTNGGKPPTVTGTAVNFRESPVGVAQTVVYTLKNTANYAVPLTPSVAVTGSSSYSITNNTCTVNGTPITLAKAETCTVSLTYLPTSPTYSTENAILTVTTDYGTTDSTPLTGVPVPAYASAGVSLQGLTFYAPMARSTEYTFGSASNGTQVDTAWSVAGNLSLRQYTNSNKGFFLNPHPEAGVPTYNTFNISVPQRANYRAYKNGSNILNSLLYSVDGRSPVTDATQWTFGTWVNSAISGGPLYAQVGNTAAAGNAFTINLTASGRNLCYTEGTGNSMTSPITLCAASTLPADSEWHFYAMTKNGNVLSVSVDGATPTVIGTIASSRTTYSNAQFVAIGGSSSSYDTNGAPTSLTTYTSADYMDMFIYSRVLSASEIQQIASRRAPLQPR